MYNHPSRRRILALFLAAITVFSLFATTALAAQPAAYRDPAEHWLNGGSRTSELDANAVLTHETFYCCGCGQKASFSVWRCPEYTKDGVTALARNVRFSDGTTVDGEGTGAILEASPDKGGIWTHYHWTKSVCDSCGMLNSNCGLGYYGLGKDIYALYDCSGAFYEDLEEVVSYEPEDDAYHTKAVDGGYYCEFCFGTDHTHTESLEKHHLTTEVKPELDQHRFAVTESCGDCGYSDTDFVAAKSVVANYYGKVDGQAHTLLVSDLSEPGVSAVIRYGLSAGDCNMVTPPSYTEEGSYNVYYEITYTCRNVSMTENGVAYVHLIDDSDKAVSTSTADHSHDSTIAPDSSEHHYAYLDTIAPTCTELGYDRYVCSICGAVEKRDYTNATGHDTQSVVIREADCDHEGKILEICRSCGEVKETVIPKGEHQYQTSTVEATCLSPGYTVTECSVCGDRHITNITPARSHNYQETVIPASCETGGKTIHTCETCGSSFVTDYTEPTGHKWDDGKAVTVPTCTGEGILQYTCTACGVTRIEAAEAKGHNPGSEATCTEPLLCLDCGAVLEPAHGHSYEDEVTEPTCTEMGVTTHTCKICGESFKSDYTNPNGHTPGDWIVDEEPTTEQEGKKHIECQDCGEILLTETMDKLYLTGTTDTHGEAVVGGYLVIVTDTNSKDPVSNAGVALSKEGTISVVLPAGRVLDYAKQTTVTILLKKDKSPVEGVGVAVTDSNHNYSTGMTGADGAVTAPTGSDTAGDNGNTTVGYEDADGEHFTFTVKVIDAETGRPIPGSGISVGKTGNITVVLPDGTLMDSDHRITVVVTDQNGNPVTDQPVIVKDDKGGKETGTTDGTGSLTVPKIIREEKHGAYVYGYPNGTFGPDRSMTRAEAAAIYARLLAEKNGDTISETRFGKTRFEDVDPKAWYAGYVKYLSEYGIAEGTGENQFEPEEAITRAEFVAMSVRFFEVYGGGSAEIKEQYTDFNDVSAGYWAANYIHAAAQRGWIQGYGDGTFRGAADITRAEVVTIVNRLLDRTADKDYINENLRRLNTFTDLTEGHWAYYDALESANAHTASYDPTEIWSR